MALHSVNLQLVINEYIVKMLNEAGVGMKCLVLDDFTLNIVSSAFTQTELLQKEVFLVEKLHIDASKKMQHLKCVCFVRPTEGSVRLVCDLLRAETYGEFYVFFSSVLPDSHLQLLAENDQREMIRTVQEMYASFLAVDPAVFTLDLKNNADLLRYSSVGPTLRAVMIDPIVEGIASFLLSVKRRPTIRHQRDSEICKRVASDVTRLAYHLEAGLFDFPSNRNQKPDKGPATLLIIDRLDDPVTPLLNQWTYQAMVHELIGIKNNRVVVGGNSGVKKQDIVVSSSSDQFFKENMFANYGDLGSSVKKLVDNFQQISKMNKQIDSIEDMARFVESFPEFRQQSGNVSKHVSLMSELSRIITEKSLMAVSMVEQEIVCGQDRAFAYTSVIEQLGNHNVPNIACLKLVLLFALRYEKSPEGHKQILELTHGLSKRNVEPVYQQLVRDLIRVAGEDKRVGDLFGSRTFFSRAQKTFSGLKGAENVYTQHTPLLVQTLENIGKGKASINDYPFASDAGVNSQKSPSEIFVFVIGGVTYEEARFVAQLNESNSLGCQIILGGTGILNSAGFLGDLTKATSS